MSAPENKRIVIGVEVTRWPEGNYTVQKNYKDKSDQWQTTSSFSYGDLIVLRHLIDIELKEAARR